MQLNPSRIQTHSLLEESQGKASLLTIGFTSRSFYSLLLKRAVAALQVLQGHFDSSSEVMLGGGRAKRESKSSIYTQKDFC